MGKYIDKYIPLRKPGTITVWYCLGQSIAEPTKIQAFVSQVSYDDLSYQRDKAGYRTADVVIQTEIGIPEDIIPEDELVKKIKSN